MKKITVYGSEPCRDTIRSRAKLDELGADYDYVDLDEHPRGAVIAARLNEGRLKTPTIVVPGLDEALIEPPDSVLEETLTEMGLIEPRGYLG